ncbi:MAG: aspartyl protease family protein [Paenibacillus macerans]|uniref:Aspartyl protease family protein n=1 Tax=Paenibacillus macerans TaxID=44252 RepID=A0A090ZDH5_PAEMA|nr:aspartyl protease family protein [Paenibacillus macerans]KFN08270.1 aspartyl protease family protein [Paenibacillus macerans]MBS5914000.1 aspartyl protease family protein [Paenibacillus macerans]MCY7557578.1 aspartyl protease family protein [Paenibacillus macerans]MDU5949279.1 aspartyl protease family protein [Paenibacillus macerans]MDU7474743.1 aspartyl protease family protein [Paenibacillus macerans]
MKIHDHRNLLTINLSVTYRGNTIQIADVILDTGSSHTIFSPDAMEQIGVTYENGDPVYEAYGIGGTVPFYTKIMDEMGLLGLDILKTNGFIVDLDKLE